MCPFTPSPDGNSHSLTLVRVLTVSGAAGAKAISLHCRHPSRWILGKTKADFLREEQRALEPFQPRLFDDLIGGD